MDSAKAGVAAITMVTGADPFLPRWLAHYQGALPENQIYVLNLGADAGVAQMVAKAGAAINLVRLPLAWYMGHYIWGEASGIFLAMLVSQIVQASCAFYIFLRYDWYRFAIGARRFRKG